LAWLGISSLGFAWLGFSSLGLALLRLAWLRFDWLRFGLLQDAKMRKICSHDAWLFWTMGFTTHQKSYFLASQMEKNELKNARCPRKREFRNSKKSNFQAPKMKKICWTVSINRPTSFRQFTIQLPSTHNPVSFNRPSCFLQQNTHFPSIIRPVNKPSSFLQ